MDISQWKTGQAIVIGSAMISAGLVLGGFVVGAAARPPAVLTGKLLIETSLVGEKRLCKSAYVANTGADRTIDRMTLECGEWFRP